MTGHELPERMAAVICGMQNGQRNLVLAEGGRHGSAVSAAAPCSCVARPRDHPPASPDRLGLPVGPVSLAELSALEHAYLHGLDGLPAAFFAGYGEVSARLVLAYWIVGCIGWLSGDD